MKRVLLWIPNYDWKISYKMWLFLNKLIVPTDIKLEIKFVVRWIITEARNELMNYALHEKFDYLWFLDDDVIPNIDILENFSESDENIITWLVRKRSEPHNICVYKRLENNLDYKPLEAEELPTLLTKVDVCWCWCVFIERKVMEYMTKTYKSPFEFKEVFYKKDKDWFYIEHPTGSISKKVWEDILFFERVNMAWFDIYADITMDCIHLSEEFLELKID